MRNNVTKRITNLLRYNVDKSLNECHDNGHQSNSRLCLRCTYVFKNDKLNRDRR